MPSKVDDYVVLSPIGSGSYGKCLKVSRRKDGKILVWKDMDYGSMTEAEKQQLVSEVNLLRELKHRYIVRYHDRIIDRSKSRLYLIMEYCPGGDLASIITSSRKERRFVDEDFIIKILTQLALALQSCHRQRQKCGKFVKVLHRDLKPANVFLDENRDVKLGDFGLARVLHHDTSFAKTFVGTPYYMSPEQMSKNQYNEKSDIWSLGCLIYELCALVPPFTAPNQKLLAEKIKQGQFRRLPSRYSDSLQNCVSSMLRLTYNARPSLEDILQLPFLKAAVKKYTPFDTENKSATPPPIDNGNACTENKMQRKKSSSESSNEDVKRPLTDLKVPVKELTLEERIQDLNRREQNLQRREKLLEEREKAAEEKMKSAESLIRQYKEMRADHNFLRNAIDAPGRGLKWDQKKQVHFVLDGKENEPALLGVDKYKYGAIVQKDAISDYGKKLKDLHLNKAFDNPTKAYNRYNSDFKSRHLLGMR